MSSNYDPKVVAAYFDEYGDREWERLERRPMDRVSLELHLRLLRRHVKAGDRVLEVGAGPGRFTISLAQMGAKVAVVDISPGQLELNCLRVGAAGHEAAVISRDVADLVDLSRLADSSYDVAMAFGGVLSYLFGRAGEGLDQLLRKVRPGGLVAFSVMSKWGSLRMALAEVLEQDRRGLREVNQRAIETGDLVGAIAEIPGMSLPHECHMFTWDEIQRLLEDRPSSLIEATATNYLSVNHGNLLDQLAGTEWERIVDWEERAGRSPGIIDAGTHILVALRRV